MAEEAALQRAIQATQAAFGPLGLTKPPLSEKLLARPPFRYLHDLITETAHATGFAKEKGVLQDKQWDAANVTDKESKIAFLNQIIAHTVRLTQTPLDVNPAKIVAGLEPIATNTLLVAIARAAQRAPEVPLQPEPVKVEPLPKRETVKTEAPGDTKVQKETKRPASSRQARPPSAAVKSTPTPAETATIKKSKEDVSSKPSVKLVREPEPSSSPPIMETKPVRSNAPATARAGPPRPKTAMISSQPTTSALPTQQDTDELDDGMIVMSSLSEMMADGTDTLLMEEEEDTLHGALVRKMLDARNETLASENMPLNQQTESRSQQKELAMKENKQLRSALQDFVSTLVPTRKLLDYLPEDIDSMAREYTMWQREEEIWEKEWKTTAKCICLLLRYLTTSLFTAKSNSATLTAMAPLETELADIEQAIRQAKETLRECKIKATENDATIKRLVQTFVEQAAS